MQKKSRIGRVRRFLKKAILFYFACYLLLRISGTISFRFPGVRFFPEDAPVIVSRAGTEWFALGTFDGLRFRFDHALNSNSSIIPVILFYPFIVIESLLGNHQINGKAIVPEAMAKMIIEEKLRQLGFPNIEVATLRKVTCDDYQGSRWGIEIEFRIEKGELEFGRLLAMQKAHNFPTQGSDGERHEFFTFSHRTHIYHYEHHWSDN